MIAPAAFDTCIAHGRTDPFGEAHRQLRQGHVWFLQCLGTLNVADDGALIAQLRAYMVVNRAWNTAVEDVVHPMLKPMVHRHVDGLAGQLDWLRASAASVTCAIETIATGGSAFTSEARRLYLLFCRFVADDLRRMVELEQQTWPLLCALFDDARLASSRRQLRLALGGDVAAPFHDGRISSSTRRPTSMVA